MQIYLPVAPREFNACSMKFKVQVNVVISNVNKTVFSSIAVKFYPI